MEKRISTESIPLEERETLANYEEITDTWSIYSSVRKHITKLTKIFSEDDISKVTVNENGTITEIFIEGASFEQVSFRNKSKPRVMTDEQREEAAERLRKARLNKK